MKRLTAEWIAKAEGDFSIVERESRARRNPSYDGVCFHAQQCVEKYLKARLCEAGISVQKLHDLTVLLDQTLPVEPMWEAYRRDLSYLSDYAVNFSVIQGKVRIARRPCKLALSAEPFGRLPAWHWLLSRLPEKAQREVIEFVDGL